MISKFKSRLEQINRGNLFSRLSMVVILIIIVAIAAIISDTFFKITNLTNIVKQMSVVTIIACGETLILILGMIDLSLGSVAAFCGCVACGIMVSTESLALSLCIALFLGMVLCMVSGWLIATFNVPSFLITLAMSMIARGSVKVYTDGVPIVISQYESFKFIGQGKWAEIPVPIIILVFIVILSSILLSKTRYGRYVYAIGGNKAAAEAAGVKTKKVVLITYAYTGLLTALAGVMLMSRINSGQSTGAEGYEFDAVTAAIIGGTSMSGGTGTIWGTLVGAFIIFILTNILNLLNVHSFYQEIVKGVIIIFAVLLDSFSKKSRLKA
jgi:Ribose/xylose/arabinose/galactoside ABC-type transport systems, permease components